MLLLFPLEEGFGEPWFPDLFAWRGGTFLPLGLACLTLVLFGGSFLERKRYAKHLWRVQ